MKIDELIKATGLTEGFIRKCLREFRGILDPHLKRGENNALLFDSNALTIFDQIKQEKEKGYSLPSIRERLFKNYEQPNKQAVNQENEVGQTRINQDDKPQEIASGSKDKLDELKDRLHQVEIEKLSVKHELDLIKNNLKLLPAGGDPHKLQELIYIISKLEDKTKSRFRRGTEVKSLWGELKSVLRGEEKREE